MDYKFTLSIYIVKFSIDIIYLYKKLFIVRHLVLIQLLFNEVIKKQNRIQKKLDKPRVNYIISATEGQLIIT